MRINLRVPVAKPAEIQPIPAIHNASTKVGFLPQWLISQIFMTAGVSTNAVRMKAKYILELKLVALILIPKYAARKSKQLILKTM